MLNGGLFQDKHTHIIMLTSGAHMKWCIEYNSLCLLSCKRQPPPFHNAVKLGFVRRAEAILEKKV